MGRSALDVSGDRKTSSVFDSHDFAAFAALCLAWVFRAKPATDSASFRQVLCLLLDNASENPPIRGYVIMQSKLYKNSFKLT
jgi:hypothetical protein